MEKLVIGPDGYEVLREFTVKTATKEQVIREHYGYLYSVELTIVNPVILANGVDAATVTATVRRYDGQAYAGEHSIAYKVNGEAVEAGPDGLEIVGIVPGRVIITAEAVGVRAEAARGEVEIIAG